MLQLIQTQSSVLLSWNGNKTKPLCHIRKLDFRKLDIGCKQEPTCPTTVKTISYLWTTRRTIDGYIEPNSRLI